MERKTDNAPDTVPHLDAVEVITAIIKQMSLEKISH
jgi:hypothetical protein